MVMNEKTEKFIFHSKQKREISLTLGAIYIFVGQLCLISIGFKMKSNITLVLLAFVEPRLLAVSFSSSLTSLTGKECQSFQGSFFIYR